MSKSIAKLLGEVILLAVLTPAALHLTAGQARAGTRRDCPSNECWGTQLCTYSMFNACCMTMGDCTTESCWGGEELCAG
ncbi:MAG TPA: hypothetical protein VLH75_03805 [Longimicrobiales bacterium]|nr:hypothetical protein [Longimicrobiales bacterium]